MSEEIEDGEHFDFLEFIPKEFHSFEKDGPFTNCVDCGCELYEAGETYSIQKSMHRGEVIFEFALCTECHDVLVKGFSKETTERLMAYFSGLEVHEPTDACCIDCQNPLEKLQSFNMAANCLGPYIQSAFLICDQWQENIQPLISEQTRRTRDDWIGKNFPCAPETRDLVPDSPLLF